MWFLLSRSIIISIRIKQSFLNFYRHRRQTNTGTCVFSSATRQRAVGSERFVAWHVITERCRRYRRYNIGLRTAPSANGQAVDLRQPDDNGRGDNGGGVSRLAAVDTGDRVGAKIDRSSGANNSWRPRGHYTHVVCRNRMYTTIYVCIHFAFVIDVVTPRRSSSGGGEGARARAQCVHARRRFIIRAKTRDASKTPDESSRWDRTFAYSASSCGAVVARWNTDFPGTDRDARVQSGTLITRPNLLALSRTGLAEFSTGPDSDGGYFGGARDRSRGRSRSRSDSFRFRARYVKIPPLSPEAGSEDSVRTTMVDVRATRVTSASAPPPHCSGTALVGSSKTARHRTVRWKRNRSHDVRRRAVRAWVPFRPSCHRTLPAGENTRPPPHDRHLRPTDRLAARNVPV